jgi:hypothetical protein
MKSTIFQLVLVIFALLGGYLASGVESAAVINVVTSLVAVSGVVVTVFGIWIAIIFPRLYEELSSGVHPKASSDNKRYNNLVFSLYRSCFILCTSVFVFLIVSFYPGSGEFYSSAVVVFSWLAFFSIFLALWSSVIIGETSVARGLDSGERKGFIRRFRSQGRNNF